MQRKTRLSLVLPGIVGVLPAFSAGPVGAEITFYKDVLPVLQRNCQECHRAGEAAPMAFTTYKDTRPWAKAIREAVLAKRMPPWFADPHVGKFTNDRSMAKRDVDALIAWVDSGAKEGDPKHAPPARAFVDAWVIGKPDIVYDLPQDFAVPASGTVEYTYAIVPTGFTEDKWIQMAEARPGDRSVVHHIIAFVREPGQKWLTEYPKGKMFVPAKRKGEAGEGDAGGGQFITGFAPGAPPEILRPGQAKLIKAGSDIVFQMHYTATGKQAKDRSRVGFIFAKEPVTQRVLTLAASNGKFVIPAGAANHRVDGSITLHADTELLSLLPHMHVRGKAFEMRAVYPTGETEDLLKVRYDFNWQLWYQLARGKVLPKGTRIEATGYFDNSPNNRHNPDPSMDVRWGDQSWEEMMIGFFDVAIDTKKDVIDLFRAPKKPATQSTSGGAE